MARSPGTATHQANQRRPSVYDSDAEDRESRRVGIIIYTVMGVVALGLIMLMAPHLFGLADRALTAKDVDVGLRDFDVVEAEDDMKQQYHVDGALVLHLVVRNDGPIPLKRLDANIMARSKDMVLANQTAGRYFPFQLVKPDAPLNPGSSVNVDAKFPLLHSKRVGYVEVEWDTKITKVE